MVARSIQGVIFDLDGTLVDTIGDIASAVNTVLKSHGFPVHPVQSYRLMVGRGFAALMREVLPRDAQSDAEFFGNLTLEAIAAYGRVCLETSLPYAEMPRVLEALEKKGKSVAILTNKPQAIARTMARMLFPGFGFIDVRGDLPGRTRKPDPSNALEIARMAGIPPQDWAFVGDSGVDMQTAVAAGMLPLGAEWGYRPRAELVSRGAEAILSKPSDLLSHI